MLPQKQCDIRIIICPYSSRWEGTQHAPAFPASNSRECSNSHSPLHLLSTTDIPITIGIDSVAIILQDVFYPRAQNSPAYLP